VRTSVLEERQPAAGYKNTLSPASVRLARLMIAAVQDGIIAVVGVVRELVVWFRHHTLGLVFVVAAASTRSGSPKPCSL
jgi:hypothetical protein